MGTSRDQMVGAWLEITNHPLWEDCFGGDDSLKESMLAKMDRLYGSEVDGNEPCTDKMARMISFEEIREGDRVRSINEAGTVLEGVVYHRFKCCWRDKGGYTVACSERMNTHDLELIDRPKPQLPAEPGTVFRATEIRGEECDVLVFVIEADHAEDPYIYASHYRVNGEISHTRAHITAWEPIENGVAR